MDIGTAKPTAAERAACRTTCSTSCRPDEPFTVADWVGSARATLSPRSPPAAGCRWWSAAPGSTSPRSSTATTIGGAAWSPEVRDAARCRARGAAGSRRSRRAWRAARPGAGRGAHRPAESAPRPARAGARQLAGGRVRPRSRRPVSRPRRARSASPVHVRRSYARIDARAQRMFADGPARRGRGTAGGRLRRPSCGPMSGHGYREAAAELAGDGPASRRWRSPPAARASTRSAR